VIILRQCVPGHGGDEAHATQVLRRGPVPLRGVAGVELVLDNCGGGAGSIGVRVSGNSALSSGVEGGCDSGSRDRCTGRDSGGSSGRGFMASGMCALGMLLVLLELLRQHHTLIIGNSQSLSEQKTDQCQVY